MEIGYTPEQEAMQHGAARLLREAAGSGHGGRAARVARHRRGAPAHLEADVRRRLGRHRLAQGVRRPGPLGDRAVHLLRRVDARRRAGADAHAQHRRPDDHGVRHRRAEGRLPAAILAGDIHFCIGYSEPGAGTDLASLQDARGARRRAYVINGQKMWTSLSSDADYCWLAVRTDPDAAKHKGISMILVPMDTPGHHAVAAQPARRPTTSTRCSSTTCVVPAGERRRRREQRLEADHQPAQPRAGHAVRERRAWSARSPRSREYAQETKLPDGRRVIDQPWVQHNLAKLHAKVEVLRLMNWQVAWEATQGVLDIGHCSALKVFGSRAQHGGLPAPHGDPRAGVVPRARRPGRGAEVAASSRAPAGSIILTFGGGVNEMQRDLISQFTLGFPRADR